MNKINKRFDGGDIFVCGRHANNTLEEEFSIYKVDKISRIVNNRSLSNGNYNDDNILTANELLDCILNALT